MFTLKDKVSVRVDSWRVAPRTGDVLDKMFVVVLPLLPNFACRLIIVALAVLSCTGCFGSGRARVERGCLLLFALALVGHTGTWWLHKVDGDSVRPYISVVSGREVVLREEIFRGIEVRVNYGVCC